MHDAHGAILAHGDLVYVPAKIVGTSNTEEYCNLVLETVSPLYPSHLPTTISLNARQVVKQTVSDSKDVAQLTLPTDEPLAIGASGVDTSEGDE